MIKQYETVFIATPVLSEAQMKEAVAKYTRMVEKSCMKRIGGSNSSLILSRRGLQVFITLSNSRLIHSWSLLLRPSTAVTRGSSGS